MLYKMQLNSDQQRVESRLAKALMFAYGNLFCRRHYKIKFDIDPGYMF